MHRYVREGMGEGHPLRPVRTGLPYRRVMRKLGWMLMKEQVRKERNSFSPCTLLDFRISFSLSWPASKLLAMFTV